jgi:predicted amidohydrolase YtcJ
MTLLFHVQFSKRRFNEKQAGYVADFSIFNRDLLKGTTEETLEAIAVKTLVGGKIVFER